MRTGDRGVYLDGELYITGRIKDMAILDGRNHNPQGNVAPAWNQRVRRSAGRRGVIPRTTSGKLARRACRAEYLDGTLGTR